MKIDKDVVIGNVSYRRHYYYDYSVVYIRKAWFALATNLIWLLATAQNRSHYGKEPYRSKWRFAK